MNADENKLISTAVHKQSIFIVVISDIDECDSVDCNNNGNCTNTPGLYECNCFTGYTGDDCDQNINECESGPCDVNANCNDTIGSYVCVCKDGFTGDGWDCSGKVITYGQGH